MKNNKGLSDVISTVLIILLVLAAVGIIGAVVLRSVGQSGQQVTTGTVCSASLIDVSACNYTAPTGTLPQLTKVDVRRITTAGYVPTTITAIVEDTTGANAAVSAPLVGSLSADGATTTTWFSAAAGVTTRRAKITVVYNNGVSCTSQPVTCITP